MIRRHRRSVGRWVGIGYGMVIVWAMLSGRIIPVDGRADLVSIITLGGVSAAVIWYVVATWGDAGVPQPMLMRTPTARRSMTIHIAEEPPAVTDPDEPLIPLALEAARYCVHAREIDTGSDACREPTPVFELAADEAKQWAVAYYGSEANTWVIMEAPEKYVVGRVRPDGIPQPFSCMITVEAYDPDEHRSNCPNLQKSADSIGSVGRWTSRR